MNNREYLKYKNWNKDNFGYINKNDKKKFSSELKRINRKLYPGMKILEIGFGNGKFLKYATSNNYDVVGLETNELLVKIAIENGYNCYSADQLEKFLPQSFDLIVAFSVLEHISQESFLSYLRSLNNLLKIDGRLLALFPNGDSPLGLPNQNGDVTHLNFIGRGKINYISDNLDMKIIYLGGESQPIFGVGLKLSIYRAITMPIKFILDYILNLLFSPSNKINYLSSNLVVVLGSGKKDDQD
jgi:SAM-dependent methyltransferase